MIRSLPLAALSLLLGFFFIFVGSIKLTPSINPDIHRDMKQEFGRFNKVFPLFKYTGWKPFAKNFRLAVGITEVVCGAILVLIPGPLKEFASFILIGLLGGAFYTHYALGDPFERMAPALVFGLLLICRFIIFYQVSQREKKELDAFKKKYESHIEANAEGSGSKEESETEADSEPAATSKKTK